MRGLARAHGAGSAALRVVVVAAMLVLASATVQAAPHGGRGSGAGAHMQGGGGDRVYRDGGGRAYGGAYRGGEPGRAYRGGGGYAGRGGAIVYGGGHYYRGGGRHWGSYGYARPRSYVSFGLGWGVPYYYPPAYAYYVEPHPAIVESGAPVDVSNEPPAGCYYYDRFCDRQFATLDEYTDHVEHQDHARTIEVVQRSSGDRLRTLEFVGGYWEVKQ